MAILRQHRLPQASDGSSLTQLQMWIDESHGRPWTDADVKSLARDAARFAMAEPAAARLIFAESRGKLLTLLAEAILEEAIFEQRLWVADITYIRLEAEFVQPRSPGSRRERVS